MKNSFKAALLSGLVFPGVGQLWLRCYLRGTALIVVVSACLAVIVQKASQQALSILEKIEAQGDAVDMVAVLRSASRVPNDSLTTLVSAVLALCWIIGVVDAYIMGRKKDLADQSRDRGRLSREAQNQAEGD